MAIRDAQEIGVRRRALLKTLAESGPMPRSQLFRRVMIEHFGSNLLQQAWNELVAENAVLSTTAAMSAHDADATVALSESAKQRPDSRGGQRPIDLTRPGQTDSRKFIAIDNILNPAPWALLFPKGTVFVRQGLRAGVDPDDLIRRGAIRVATPTEVKSFEREFPISANAESEHSAKMRAFRVALECERQRARRWSDKAVLCRTWIGKLVQLDADYRRVWETLPPAPRGSERDELRIFVGKNREARMAYEPCRLLREYLKSLGEALVVEAEEFSDLPPTPLIDFIRALDMQWTGLNPTQMPADAYVERLRFKFLNKEPRPGPIAWAKHRWKSLTAIIVTISAVITGIAAIIHNSKEIREDLQRKPATQPATRVADRPDA